MVDGPSHTPSVGGTNGTGGTGFAGAAEAARVTTLDAAIAELRARGVVTLPGTYSVGRARWRRNLRGWMTGFLIAAGVGVVTLIVGIVLRDVDAWSLVAVLGGLLGFFGLAAAGVIGLVLVLWRGVSQADLQPVVLDASGVRLRSIGPIPWADLEPPARRRVVTKHDMNGLLAVMPLTPNGRARANAVRSSATLLIGPVPWMRLDVPYLTLPGIEGLSEDEVMHLFGEAHRMFLTGPAGPGATPHGPGQRPLGPGL